MNAIKAEPDRFVDISAKVYFEVSDPGGVFFNSQFPIELKAEFDSDPLGFVLKHAEVTEEELFAFYDSQGEVRCIAKTKAGHRCKLTPSWVGGYVPLHEWIANRDWLCHMHGGS